jgi:YD repeat-containing protein
MNMIRLVIAVLLGPMALVQVCDAATTTYQYDALGRLTTASQGTTSTTYNYDLVGNRATKQVSSVTPTPISFAPSGTLLEHQGSVVLTANVGSSSTTGTVSFYDGATLIGSTTLTNGVATITVTGLHVGSQTITVAYSGGGSTPATSIGVQVRVVNIDVLPAILQLLLQ